MKNNSFITEHRSAGVTLQPDTWRAMQHGIGQIVDAIRPTLGPRPRITVIERHPRTRAPELLDNGALIARRIIEVENQYDNVGAMFIRGMLWRLHEEVGDGTATAAVLFQAIYNQGLRYIAAGCNAMRMRPYLEEGMRLILDYLDEQTLPIESPEQLARLAVSACYDAPMADILSEIFNVIGEYGLLEIRGGHTRHLVHEYVQGSYWFTTTHSPAILGGQPNAQLDNAALLISDLEIKDARELLPAIQVAANAGIASLVIIVRSLSEQAVGLITSSHSSKRLRLFAIKTPGQTVPDQVDAMEDIAVLTGGRPFHAMAGATLRSITPEHFGHARRVWFNKELVNIIIGQGDPLARREQIAMLRLRLKQTDDSAQREKLRERIGRLSGSAAILHVGGATETEIAARKGLAQQTAHVLRSALGSGAIYGGGMTLLNCRERLQQRLAASTDDNERAAFAILLSALDVPLSTILINAGADPGAVIAEVSQAGPRHGFDALSMKIVNLPDAAILDVAGVQKAAVRSAISSAALALTVDTMVHRAVPGISLDPDGRK